MKKVFVAHPFLGKRSNMQTITAICRNLAKLGIKPFSPVHAYLFLHDNIPAERKLAMEWCGDDIETMDAMFLCGAWRESEGCQHEHNVALLELIPVYEIVGWRGDKPVFKEEGPSWLKESGGK